MPIIERKIIMNTLEKASKLISEKGNGLYYTFLSSAGTLTEQEQEELNQSGVFYCMKFDDPSEHSKNCHMTVVVDVEAENNFPEEVLMGYANDLVNSELDSRFSFNIFALNEKPYTRFNTISLNPDYGNSFNHFDVDFIWPITWNLLARVLNMATQLDSDYFYPEITFKFFPAFHAIQDYDDEYSEDAELLLDCSNVSYEDLQPYIAGSGKDGFNLALEANF